MNMLSGRGLSQINSQPDRCARHGPGPAAGSISVLDFRFTICHLSSSSGGERDGTCSG